MIKDNEHAGSSLDDFPETGSDTFIPGFSLPDPESIFTYTGGIQSPVSILCALQEAYFGEHTSNQTSQKPYTWRCIQKPVHLPNRYVSPGSPMGPHHLNCFGDIQVIPFVVSFNRG